MVVGNEIVNKVGLVHPIMRGLTKQLTKDLMMIVSGSDFFVAPNEGMKYFS